jgi:hypothetical protein
MQSLAAAPSQARLAGARASTARPSARSVAACASKRSSSNDASSVAVAPAFAAFAAAAILVR